MRTGQVLVPEPLQNCLSHDVHRDQRQAVSKSENEVLTKFFVVTMNSALNPCSAALPRPQGGRCTRGSRGPIRTIDKNESANAAFDLQTEGWPPRDGP